MKCFSYIAISIALLIPNQTISRTEKKYNNDQKVLSYNSIQGLDEETQAVLSQFADTANDVLIIALNSNDKNTLVKKIIKMVTDVANFVTDVVTKKSCVVKDLAMDDDDEYDDYDKKGSKKDLKMDEDEDEDDYSKQIKKDLKMDEDEEDDDYNKKSLSYGNEDDDEDDDNYDKKLKKDFKMYDDEEDEDDENLMMSYKKARKSTEDMLSLLKKLKDANKIR